MTQQPHFCGSLFSQSGQECDEAAWWQEKKYLKCSVFSSFLTLHLCCPERRTLWRKSSGGACKWTSVYALFSVLSSLLCHTQHQERQRQLGAVRCWLPLLPLWDHTQEHHAKGASFGKESPCVVGCLGGSADQLCDLCKTAWPFGSYFST